MARLPAAALAALLLATLAPTAPADPAHDVVDYYVTVDGEVAHGLIAMPIGLDAPRGLVVIAHGYGHVAESHRGHLAHLAEQGFVAVAMDFRGTGFPLATGAADTLAAARDLAARVDGPAYLYSVSMGTAVASLVLQEADGLFSYWVSNEGLSMLHETWAGASALADVNDYAARAKADIEAECGGTPAAAWECYEARSAALNAADFTGLEGAILAHGVNDGLVPYNQGRELAGALRAAGVPTDFHTVARCHAGGEGTTLTGYTPLGGMGVAGHGTESDDDHCMTAVSFGLLDQLVNGETPADREFVVDDEAGTLP